jgi:hypothetical protein
MDKDKEVIRTESIKNKDKEIRKAVREPISEQISNTNSKDRRDAVSRTNSEAISKAISDSISKAREEELDNYLDEERKKVSKTLWDDLAKYAESMPDGNEAYYSRET